MDGRRSGRDGDACRHDAREPRTHRPRTHSLGGTQAVYAAALVAALTRICATMHPDRSDILLLISGAAWAGAFFGFAALYGPERRGPTVGRGWLSEAVY